MSILKILHYPDQRLRNIASLVSVISSETKKIIRDMFDTMYFAQGIGLAATQVNIHQQIIVIDLNKGSNQRIVLINPVIIHKSGIINTVEGCLSIPKITDTISRAKNITINALDQYGNKFQIQASNLLSVCIQHEIDHLLGKLFIDYLSPLKIKKINETMKIK